MTRLSSVFVMLAFFLPVLKAQEWTDLPKGPQPHLVVAMIDKDRILFTQVGLEYVTTKEIRIEERNGKKVEVAVQVVKAVPRPFRFAHEAKNVKYFTNDGKEINANKAEASLRKSTGVFFSTDGNPVDPFYLRMSKEGTLVLVVAPNIQPEFIPLPKAKP